MLRLLVLMLLVANGLYYGWTQGFFKTYGWAPTEASEPQRLKQQIRPEALVVIGAAEERSSAHPPAPSTQPLQCLRSTVIEEGRLSVVRGVLAVLPAGTWQLEAVSEPARWMVYLGKFASDELHAKKRIELERLSLKPEVVHQAELSPGWSLGGYPSQAQAQEALADLQKRGVRTARVVQERPDLQGGVLTLPRVDPALRSRLEALQPALGDVSFSPCP